MNGNRVWFGVGILVVLALLLLWQIKRVQDDAKGCCDDLRAGIATVETKVDAVAKGVDQLKSDGGVPHQPGPGNGPIIVLGPGSGGTALWKLDKANVTQWDGNHRIRSDAWGTKVQFYVKPQVNVTTQLTRFRVVIGTHSIVITNNLNGQIGWTMDDAPIDPCDMASGGSHPLCSGQGLPAEFNGNISSIKCYPQGGADWVDCNEGTSWEMDVQAKTP